jgi:hypothetical protein
VGTNRKYFTEEERITAKRKQDREYIARKKGVVKEGSFTKREYDVYVYDTIDIWGYPIQEGDLSKVEIRIINSKQEYEILIYVDNKLKIIGDNYEFN